MAFHPSRRTVLLAGAASAVLPGNAYGQASNDLIETESDALFWDNAEPAAANQPSNRALNDWPLWWEQTNPPAATWHVDATAVDTRHLPDGFKNTEFVLSPAVLRRALLNASIDPAPLGERVLFGIRAASLTDASAAKDKWTTAIGMTETRPDHFEARCLMGVWNTSTDEIWVTPGSTVCNVAYLYGQSQAKQKEKLCNLLPAGVYRYVVGTHRNNSSSRQPGAFRLDSDVAILRSFDDGLGFTVQDLWEFRGPDVADNIHAAYYMPDAQPRFSSAGCQVVPGTVGTKTTRDKHIGEWRGFRIAAGLSPDPVVTAASASKPWNVSTPDDGKRFHYVLLSCRELRLAASAGQDDLRKLRRGSTGDGVVKLQTALGAAIPDGVFGLDTQRKLIFRQQTLLGWADGVLTPADLAQLDLPNVFG